MLNKVMRVLVSALALAGLVVSILALRVHYMDPFAAPPCSVTEHWDCGAVNHSPYAVFPRTTFDDDPAHPGIHIPVAAIGIAGYILILLFALLGRWWIVLPMAVVGCGFALRLTYIEAYVMHKWCIYCVWSQAIVAVLLLTTLIAAILRPRPAGALAA